MTILSGKPKHLFIVKDGRVGLAGKTVAAEQFSPEQRAAVERALTMAARPMGVLVGAHFMESVWDVRPLVLEKGIMTITRFTDPGLSASRQEGIARVHGALSGVAGVIACGRASGPGGAQLWMRRKFSAATLGENPSTDAISTMHPLHLARRLVSYVRYLESLGIIHGHLSASNVAFEGDNPVLLDYGFAGWGGGAARYSDLAPEITRGGEPTSASDVFGLALVLKGLLSAHLSPEQLAFIEKMAALEPGDRPVIGAVEAFFSGGAAPIAATSPREIPVGPRLGSGRVVPPARPAPIPEQIEQPTLASPTHPESPSPRPIERPANPLLAPASPPPINVPPHEEEVPPGSGPPRLESRDSRSWSGWLVVTLLAGIGALFHFDIIQLNRTPAAPRIPFAVFWASGQPQMMRQVAEAALVDGDPTAEVVIVSDALKGGTESSRMVRAGVIRVGYNPLWQHELEGVDREVILGLSLAAILGRRPPNVPDLTTLHPGVVVALAADLDLTADFPPLRAIPLTDLAQLPAPYGPAFLDLVKGGILTLADPAARAVSHLLAGDASAEVLRAFVPDDLSPQAVTARVRILVTLLGKHPAMERTLVKGALDSGALAPILGWFESDAIVDWSKVSTRDRLALVGGLPGSSSVSTEHYAELLRFPLETVRDGAAQRLAETVSRPTALVVAVARDETERLSREQVVALIAALEVSGIAGTTFIQGWFGTEPDPRAVLHLLIARSSLTEIDTFNVEAARYLKGRRWEFTLDEIEALTRHNEPLARALAYARLDVRDTAQRSILAKAVERELSVKLKEQITAKLNFAESP